MNRTEIYAKIDEVAQIIGKGFQPEKIILFGSYAWGEPNSDSDVDLFVIKKTDDTRALGRKISRLIFPRPFPLDVIVYRPDQVEAAQKKDFFIRDVIQKGRLLYGK